MEQRNKDSLQEKKDIGIKIAEPDTKSGGIFEIYERSTGY
jgi:hypothetical protein